MNETAASISATLENIREAAPRLSRHQVRALTARLRVINDGLRQHQAKHQVPARNLNGNGRRDANPYEDSIPAPPRPRPDTGGRYDPWAEWEHLRE